MHSALNESIYRALNNGPHFKAQIVDPKFLAQNGHFVVTKKVLSRHGSYLCHPALVVACSFLSRHIFMLSSSIL